MIGRTPSLKSLLAFEAAVRLGSMTAAARELGTTQPAVSQRIRQLEEIAGLPLLDRGSRDLKPTGQGRTYYDDVAGALHRIDGATRRLQAQARARTRVLTIAAHFGFAHLWLLPRLPRLQVAFPGTAFEVLPVDGDLASERTGADLTIRFGSFGEMEAHEFTLFPETVSPVCTPAFAGREGIDDAVDAGTLAKMPLLHMDAGDPRWLDWSGWCDLAGFPDPPPGQFFYRNYPLLLNAAIDGRGLALGWRGLIDGLGREGTLIALEPRVRVAHRGYLLAAPSHDMAAIAPIVDWFRRECEDVE